MKFIKKNFKLLIGIFILALTLNTAIVSADVSGTPWFKNAADSLATNTGNGLANADIHVRNCYIGLSNAVPCGGGGGTVLSVKENGSTILTGVTILNFTGAVTVTDAGSNQVNIAIAAGILNLAPIGVTPNANGASISGDTLFLQPASADFGGVVTTTTQTFEGAKTFLKDTVIIGKVGIGTAAPSAKLHVLNDVVGTTALYENTAGNTMVTFATPTGGASLIGFNINSILRTRFGVVANGDFEFYQYSAVPTLLRTLLVFTNSTGFVGISDDTTNAPTSRLDVNTDALGTTQTTSSGLALTNTTAAAAGTQQISPAIRWRGLGWKTNSTAASQPVDFRAYNLPIQGTVSPSGNLIFQSAINAGSYTSLFAFGSAGDLKVGSSLDSGSAGQVLTSNGAGAAPSWATASAVSGTYAPTLTNQTNITSSTAFVTNYMQVGDMVTVSGKLNFTPTGGGAAKILISLPIPSGFTNAEECGGTANASEVGNNAAILATPVSQTCEFDFGVGSVSPTTFGFIFMYKITPP